MVTGDTYDGSSLGNHLEVAWNELAFPVRRHVFRRTFSSSSSPA
jgi:hypothetical protein